MQTHPWGVVAKEAHLWGVVEMQTHLWVVVAMQTHLWAGRERAARGHPNGGPLQEGKLVTTPVAGEPRWPFVVPAGCGV